MVTSGTVVRRVGVGDFFPLTTALSLGKREKPLADLDDMGG